jgi:hypothetical protein
MPKLEIGVDVSGADILRTLFSRENILRTLRRIRRDDDTLVAHPLRRIVVLEYAEHLAEVLSRLVPSGRWSPTSAYVCLVRKRSGNFRELVFPGLIDSLVGRCVIDALEPYITADDEDRTFCGRMHANTRREPGDYERWFSVWQDYTSAIAKAARESGFAYVYDTDVSDFFPSVDRTKARQFLAERTRAHPPLLELLFFCLEAWLPRFSYAPMSGIPVENNDISRLVAHNYLKVVDRLFVSDPSCQYLRYVDDTVIFVKSEGDAEDAKRRHHLALRQVGLNPNAAKSQIVPVEEFEADRHRDFNLRITDAKALGDSVGFAVLAEEWYARDRTTTVNWDRVARHLYATARQKRFDHLRPHVIGDLVRTPEITEHALTYLRRFEVIQQELDGLLQFCRESLLGPEPEIHLARFMCEARFSFDASETVADFAVARIAAPDSRHGAGYAKALWLLVLHKHGKHRHRKQVGATLDKLEDEQFRLHFLYVFFACGELSDDLVDKLRHLSNPDIELTMRLCAGAKEGRLQHHGEILKRLKEARSIQARYLPLLRLMLQSEKHRDHNEQWLSKLLDPKGKAPLADQVVRRFLTEAYARLTA